MGNFPSGGISYAFGSSNWDDEDIVPQADKRANAPMQIAQKIKLRKLSGFFALFPILASFGLLDLFFVIVHRRDAESAEKIVQLSVLCALRERRERAVNSYYFI